jgi:hypothetical protein
MEYWVSRIISILIIPTFQYSNIPDAGLHEAGRKAETGASGFGQPPE